MQRVAWTDGRLDDLSHRVEVGFERVDRDIRDLRAEMNQGFTVLRAELGEEISELRALLWRLNGGIIVAVVVAILLRGF
jgi:hypothetical protein